MQVAYGLGTKFLENVCVNVCTDRTPTPSFMCECLHWNNPNPPFPCICILRDPPLPPKCKHNIWIPTKFAMKFATNAMKFEN